MGGYIALEIMRQAPDRVPRLALLDTSARPDTHEKMKFRQELIDLARIGQFKGVTPRLLPKLIHPERLADPALVDSILAMAERVGRDAFLRQQRLLMNRPDSRHDLRSDPLPDRGDLRPAGRLDAACGQRGNGRENTARPSWS